MNAEQFLRFQLIMNSLNEKQREIATKILMNESAYTFSNKLAQIHIKINKTDQEYNLVDYIKMICGCD